MDYKTPLNSPPGFHGSGAVGLAIVAAMSVAASNAKTTPPIPIVSPRPREVVWGVASVVEDDYEYDDEMSESYTCVISHVPGSSFRKRVYFNDGSDGLRSKFGTSPGVFFQSPPLPPSLAAATAKLKAVEFLNRCYRCTKSLHGSDIFIYRGDKAFCSSECRCQQILNDEYVEKCSYGAPKQFECSVFPCLAPLIVASGVAAS